MQQKGAQANLQAESSWAKLKGERKCFAHAEEEVKTVGAKLEFN